MQCSFHLALCHHPPWCDMLDRLAMKELAAGAISGAMAAIVTAPLDLAKTRMQVQKKYKEPRWNQFGPNHLKYVTLSGTLRRTLADEGVRGLFKGLGSTILGLVPNWALYFASYGRLKSLFNDGIMKDCPPTATHIAAATVAGAITTCATNPLWLVKVRLQTQFDVESTYRGIGHAFAKIYAEEGIRGFYRGLPASLMGVAHVALQFPLYEALKTHYKADEPGKDLDLWGLIQASSLSKIVASSVTYPHEVIRTRFQTQGSERRYTSLSQCMRKIYREEGLHTFFRGISANLIRVVPACTVTFASFEYAMRFFHHES